MKVKDKFLTMYRSDRVHLAEWILIIVTGAFVFLTASAWDLQSLTIWSTNVWDSIADGKFRSFYAYTAENHYHAHHAHMGSELMSVLPWSVWNLPIWAMQRFGGMMILDSPLMLAYSKLFLPVVTVILLIFAKKITESITGDKNKGVWVMFLSAGSVYLYLSVCYSGQNDILMMAPSVIGIWYLLQGKRRTFLLWSMLAIAIKPFYILPLLAVLLLSEKRILRVLLETVFVCLGLVAQKLFFMGTPGYSESMNTGPALEMLQEMFPGNLSTSFGKISFFAVALVLVYFYCYTRDFSMDGYADRRGMLPKYTVYIISVVYTAYLMFSPFSFYRLAILVPFLYIVLVQNDKMRFYNALFDTVMQFALLMRLVLRGSKLFRVDFLNRSVINLFFRGTAKYSESNSFASVENYMLNKMPILDDFQPMFSGVAVVSAVMLLALNHPEKQIKLKVGGDKNIRALLWVRALLILPFALLSVYLFIRCI